MSLLRACELNGDGEYMVNGVRLNAWIRILVEVSSFDFPSLLEQCWMLGVLSMTSDGAVWLDKNGAEESRLHYWDTEQEKMIPTGQTGGRLLSIVMPWKWKHCDQFGTPRNDITLEDTVDLKPGMPPGFQRVKFNNKQAGKASRTIML